MEIDKIYLTLYPFINMVDSIQPIENYYLSKVNDEILGKTIHLTLKFESELLLYSYEIIEHHAKEYEFIEILTIFFGLKTFKDTLVIKVNL